MVRSFFLIVACLTSSIALAEEPRVLDDALELSLFAESPDIVTPVAMAFDQRGRLLVVESHTHHRQDNYQGPSGDRIRVLTDTDGDGRADKFETYFEGSKHTMSIAACGDGSIYVATRMKIFRLEDTDNDGKPDRSTDIAWLDTEGDYPHNGLAGLLFDGRGNLYFGFGENLGLPYKLVGSDGTTLAGEAEGGTFYRCRQDGSKLKLFATGFWNPFSSCFDTHGRIFTVDNDPDGMPPCRLLQVVPGADYGYQFRYGRSGRHPLQAWDGELPGTLPLAAGVGEAPSGILNYRGKLWITSWGDHRIERHTVQPVGAMAQTSSEIVIQGDEDFRPVSFAESKGGTVFISDWVNRSYPVHGQGRVWKMRWKGKVEHADFAALSKGEERAAKLRQMPEEAALSDPDPYIRQAAAYGFANATPPQWTTLESGIARAELLQAIRFANPDHAERHVAAALKDDSDEVKIVALRWLADLNLKVYRDQVRQLLNEDTPSLALFRAMIATIAWLDAGEAPKGRQPEEAILTSILDDRQRPARLRAMALRALSTRPAQVSASKLIPLESVSDPLLKRELVHTASMIDEPLASDILFRVVSDSSLDIATRADAVAGLAGSEKHQSNALRQIQRSNSELLVREATRWLRPNEQRLSEIAAQRANGSTPPASDIDAWLARIGKGGDKSAGRRVFFDRTRVGCAKCHRFDGRGENVGPDLTGIGKQANRRKLLESILQPSREVGPRYSPWHLESVDGKTHVGLFMPRPYNGSGEDGKEFFVDRFGKEFQLESGTIETRRQLKTSIMPDGLQQLISDDELRDLLAFLES